jgi:hypothetical protein
MAAVQEPPSRDELFAALRRARDGRERAFQTLMLKAQRFDGAWDMDVAHEEELLYEASLTVENHARRALAESDRPGSDPRRRTSDVETR